LTTDVSRLLQVSIGQATQRQRVLSRFSRSRRTLSFNSRRTCGLDFTGSVLPIRLEIDQPIEYGGDQFG
jgi:hypothetical protein